MTACVEVVLGATKDDEAVESFGRSLARVLMILVRAATEGSMIVMMAIKSNTPRAS